MKRASIAFLTLLPWALPAARQEQWLRLTTPDFEITTSSSERDSRDLLKVFEQIRGFFEKASPVPLLEQFPVSIVAFGNAQQFRPYSPRALSVAFAVSNRKADYIVMQDASPDSYGIAVHEYMHLLVRHSGLRLPTWLNEGWADVYSTLRPVRDGVAVGDLIPARMQALASDRWLSFDELTSVTTNSPAYNESSRIGIFYAQSWALVHMLFLAPEYSEGFPKFLIAIHRGASAAEACETAWGRSPDQVFEDLRNYFGRKKLYGRVFEAPLGKSARDVTVTKLDAFDVTLTLADLKAVMGRVPEARSDYEELARMRPGSAEVAEALGYLNGSREEFEKAFAGGDSDPRMCYLLGVMEREAHRPEQAMAAFERAVRSKPDYADALLQLGLMRVAARQYEGAIESLMSIGKVTPVHATSLFSALAYAYLETGDLDRARANALTAKKWATEPKETNGIAAMLGLIEARAKGPFPPHPGEKTERVEGMLQSLECEGGRHRLVLTVGNARRVFELPDEKAVEFTQRAGGTALQLACGAQTPVPLAVDYAVGSGAVRRLEF